MFVTKSRLSPQHGNDVILYKGCLVVWWLLLYYCPTSTHLMWSVFKPLQPKGGKTNQRPSTSSQMYLRYEKETRGNTFLILLCSHDLKKHLTPDCDTNMSPQRWVSTVSSLSQLSASISVFGIKTNYFQLLGNKPKNGECESLCVRLHHKFNKVYSVNKAEQK